MNLHIRISVNISVISAYNQGASEQKNLDRKLLECREGNITEEKAGVRLNYWEKNRERELKLVSTQVPNRERLNEFDAREQLEAMIL